MQTPKSPAYAQLVHCFAGDATPRLTPGEAIDPSGDGRNPALGKVPFRDTSEVSLSSISIISIVASDTVVVIVLSRVISLSFCILSIEGGFS